MMSHTDTKRFVVVGAILFDCGGFELDSRCLDSDPFNFTYKFWTRSIIEGNMAGVMETRNVYKALFKNENERVLIKRYSCTLIGKLFEGKPIVA